MDEQDDRVAENEPQPPDAVDESPAEQEQAASQRRREPQNGLMNRFLRGLGIGRDEDASADAPPEQAAEPPLEPTVTPPTPEPERLTMTAEEFRRAVQSAKDRELVQERRQFALSQADAGDLLPIRQLAEKGDGWARHQLAERGETWTLGEIHEAELKAQAKAQEDPVPAIATSFDQTVIWPILAALPEAEERRIVGAGIVGMAGRQKAVEASIEVIQRESVISALSEEKFVSKLLKSEAFREALVKNPVANKQFRNYFRGDLEEPDHVPAAASGRRRENDFMNDLLRGVMSNRDQDDE